MRVGLHRLSGPQCRDRLVEIGRGELPFIVEIGDDAAHERRVQRLRGSGVAQVVIEQRERQLRRLGPLIAPFKAVFGEPELIVMTPVRSPAGAS